MSNIENGNKQKQTATENLLRPAGGYENLKVYKLATLIYDITVRFAELYIPANSRTCDQMVQAARSGRQNIAEGSIDAATSAKLEINLYNVARGSMEELKLDYQDYLRQHGVEIWQKDDPFVQKFISLQIASKKQFREFVASTEQVLQNTVYCRSLPLKSVIVANAAILLINVASFWLKKLIAQKMDDFIEEGGFSERLYRIRSQKRKSDQSYIKNN